MVENSSLTVEIQPSGRRIEIGPGETLQDACRAGGAGLISLCGGEGWCGSCLVRVTNGKVTPPTDQEIKIVGQDKIAAGYRLACRTEPLTDVQIDIPPDSLSTPQRLQLEGQDFNIPISPADSVLDLNLDPPELKDLRDDARRLLDGLGQAGDENVAVNYQVLRNFSGLIRKLNWSARIVLRQGEVIAVLPQNTPVYGLAVDIGTTKLALYLVDLLSGVIVDKAGEMNPQIGFGEDVISRISYTREHPTGRAELQSVLIETLNKMIGDICDRTGIRTSQVVDGVFVGNTAMHHLFAGLPVDQLVFAPYLPALSTALDIQAADLDLRLAPGAYVHLLPNIAGYVGADHAAVILSTELWKTQDTVLAVDIGTNTEISLVHQGRISSCSCASGPAFEGAHIHHGMRAAPGAIEKVRITGDEIDYYTIENQPPIGICGSGILDVVAALKTADLMDEKGVIREGSPLIRMGKNELPEIILVPASESGNGREITVSRKDINEIQLAKAAIRSGLEILLAEEGIQAAEIDRILVAGAFGTYISIPNAIEIGMFPRIPVERFQQVGNAAGMGAVQALISSQYRTLISEVIEKVHYLELTTYGDFQKIYLESMYLR